MKTSLLLSVIYQSAEIVSDPLPHSTVHPLTLTAIAFVAGIVVSIPFRILFNILRGASKPTPPPPPWQAASGNQKNDGTEPPPFFFN